MTTYSAWIGLQKTIWNVLVVAGPPAFLAFLANVPNQYAWIAGPVAYFIKNWLKNRK